jgi:hypothetical protein
MPRDTHRHHIGAVLVKELQVVEGVGQGRGVLGEDQVEAGVLWRAGRKGAHRWLQVKGPVVLGQPGHI